MNNMVYFNKGLAPSFNVASRSEAAMKFQLGIDPQLKLNMEPAASETGDILPKLYKQDYFFGNILPMTERTCVPVRKEVST